jgi:N-acyl-D-amino-acid deacylase
MGENTVSIVIRSGLVVDGTGAPPFVGDVRLHGDRIVEVGPRVDDAGAEIIDATGRVVTPGFVDPHSHFDGQVTWDGELGPTAWHGVTTTVMGNCGVGFAPVRPQDREFLIELMEGVEDIPGTALHEGITWGWESFPEYLDVVASRRRTIDVAAQIPHGALRFYVMGQRAVDGSAPTASDVATMGRLVREAIEAGAVGFSTNRLPSHRAKDGTPVPGTYASVDELLASAQGVRAGGHGLVQVTGAVAMGDRIDYAEHEVALYAQLSIDAGVPVMFTVTEINQDPDLWRRQLDWVDEWNGRGAQLIVQTHGRPTGLVVDWQAFNPFAGRSSYDALASMPIEERVARLREPATRAAILSDEPAGGNHRMSLLRRLWGSVYPMADGPSFEPDASESIGAKATAGAQNPETVLYDAMCAGSLQLSLGGYRHGDLSSTYGLLTHPATVLGLADGGAHCSIICDSSMPSFLLQHWVRDRTRGPKLSLADGVRMLTSRPAQVYGLTDRGRLAAGLRADVNIIDLDAMTLGVPEFLHDLPAGAPRVVQRASGYDMTICAGEVTFRHGAATGALPGRLVRA